LEDQDEADIAADVGPVVALSVMSELLDVGLEGAELFMEQTPRLLRYAKYGPTPQDYQVAAEAAARRKLPGCRSPASVTPRCPNRQDGEA
ncbi:MAG TPA: hypothetical protein VF933_37370, partial [Streptosporangiaceae bacterium]